MANYLQMNPAERQKELTKLQELYQQYIQQHLQLDMSRGKPSVEQLNLSMEMLHLSNYTAENGLDTRNYGLLEGLPEARRFFAEILEVSSEEVIVCGTSSLQMMFFLIELGYRKGFPESPKPWCKEDTIKFLCPVPGYDRHFRIAEYFGFELISVPMLSTGPDMDLVEQLVQDPSVKGIWCVPLYSNPDGYSFCDETVKRLANMTTAAPDFKIIWDHAYCVHHLNDTPDTVLNILDLCKNANYSTRPVLFCSTSKITFPGAGVAALAGCSQNIAYMLQHMSPMLIGFDKMNQLRHVQYLKNKAGVLEHMKKHAQILQPKFEKLLHILYENLTPCGDIARWTQPNGGYFISLYTQQGCAYRVVELCKQAGVVLTDAGAAYPYGKDPLDRHIRLAPSFPNLDELEIAGQLLTLCVRIACLEKLSGHI